MWLGIVMLLASAISWGGNRGLNVGDDIPDFTLLDENETAHTLSDYRGQKVVVYFYPKDDTPGCIKEACNFRDHFLGFEKQNIKVFGISYDSPESHKKFKEKYGLPYTLLCDERKEVTRSYGVAGLLFPKRVTFLIGEQGKILRIYDKVNVTTHGEEILLFFSSLEARQ